MIPYSANNPRIRSLILARLSGSADRSCYSYYIHRYQQERTDMRRAQMLVGPLVAVTVLTGCGKSWRRGAEA